MNGTLKKEIIKIVMIVGLHPPYLFQRIKEIAFNETSLLFNKIINNYFCSLRYTHICYSFWCNIFW